MAQPVALWNGRGTQPAIAASAAGDVAIAGGRDHRIVVYRSAELRQNRAARQVLDSSGQSVRAAAIARQGKRIWPGAELESQGASRGKFAPEHWITDRVFDMGVGEFVADRRGWTIDAPDAGGWSVRYEPARAGADRSALSIVSGGRVASRVELGARQQLGDYAVLPPRRRTIGRYWPSRTLISTAANRCWLCSTPQAASEFASILATRAASPAWPSRAMAGCW